MTSVRNPATGLRWGAALGAASGAVAAFVFMLAVGVFTFVADGMSMAELPEFVVLVCLYGIYSAVVGAAIGGVIGAFIGLVLGFVRMEKAAPYIAASIVLIPFVVGPTLMEDRNDTIGYILLVSGTAAIYAAIGWRAGSVFARRLQREAPGENVMPQPHSANAQ